MIGLMSGTSVDGIDAALVEIGSDVTLRHFATYPFDPEVRRQVFALFRPETSSVDQICRMNVVLGHAFADAALALCQEAGVSPQEVDLIGSHGQTVWHDPDGSPPSTLQIGEAAVIAEKTGAITVADFRVRDMAAGGQGAPLVPYADYRLLLHPTRGRAIQNIGGIGNVTHLPPACAPDDVLAFDTGPGNMIMDALCQEFYGERYDRDGRRAAAGRVIPELLAELMAHPYLAAAPPKSTGREEFGVQFVQRLIGRGAPDDLIATATAFTAHAIADAYRRFLLPRGPVNEVLVCGGGAANPTLLSLLRSALPEAEVLRMEEIGFSSEAKEAVAFALMAHDAVLGLPTNVPGATGARYPVVLGKVSV